MFYYYLTKLNSYRAASDGTVNVQKLIELQSKRQTVLNNHHTFFGS